MINALKVLTIAFIITCQLLIIPDAIAGDNIPSKKELEYATNVYALMKNFDNKEQEFLKSMEKVPIAQKDVVINGFKNKFDYTKKYYLDMMASVPTSKFSINHTALLEGIYGNLQYLKAILTGLEKGKDLSELTKMNAKMFQQNSQKYETAINTFMDTIKTWQKPYMDKITKRES